MISNTKSGYYYSVSQIWQWFPGLVSPGFISSAAGLAWLGQSPPSSLWRTRRVTWLPVTWLPATWHPVTWHPVTWLPATWHPAWPRPQRSQLGSCPREDHQQFPCFQQQPKRGRRHHRCGSDWPAARCPGQDSHPGTPGAGAGRRRRGGTALLPGGDGAAPGKSGVHPANARRRRERKDGEPAHAQPDHCSPGQAAEPVFCLGGGGGGCAGRRIVGRRKKCRLWRWAVGFVAGYSAAVATAARKFSHINIVVLWSGVATIGDIFFANFLSEGKL